MPKFRHRRRTTVSRMPPTSDNLFIRAWRRLTGSVRPWRPAALFALVGVGVIAASLLPGHGIDDSWTRDLLLTVGSSLVLFAPLYLITRTLDSHLDVVQAETRQQVAEVRTEAAAATAEVRSNVETLQADVDRRLDDVAQRVDDRLKAEAEADEAAFDSLRTDAPTRATVLEALERADRLGLTTLRRPPRVDISGAGHAYISLQFDPGDMTAEPLLLRMESTSGQIFEWISWPEDRNAEDVLVEIGRLLRKHTGEVFVTQRLLRGLADLLDAALSSAERRPAIELCTPQWMICEWGAVTYDRAPYRVTKDRIRELSGHVASKPWVDADSWDRVQVVALLLFPTPLAPFDPAKNDPPF